MRLSRCALALLVACVAGTPAVAQDSGADIDKLYELVKQARAELKALRMDAGLPAEPKKRERRGEHDERRGEHGERRGEHDERRGEHGERREGRGEESGKRLAKHEKWDATRKGARLILAYDAATQSFKGTVVNTTSKTLPDVRVEVHLSNGVELGPTKRTDLKPGAKLTVELAVTNPKFKWWTTHPEHGREEHGKGHEEEGDREHGEGTGNRPKNAGLRPLYNQIELLHREIRALRRELAEKK